MLVGNKQKQVKFREANYNDERVKLVSDMINGIRTIKSYGWENHYLAKIAQVREKQADYVWKYNLFQSLAVTFYNNFGFYAYLAVILVTYFRGVEFKAGEQLALLSLLFFLFMNVNGMTVWSISNSFCFHHCDEPRR